MFVLYSLFSQTQFTWNSFISNYSRSLWDSVRCFSSGSVHSKNS